MCDHVHVYINVMNAVDYVGGALTISMAELFIAIWDWKRMNGIIATTLWGFPTDEQYQNTIHLNEEAIISVCKVKHHH